MAERGGVRRPAVEADVAVAAGLADLSTRRRALGRLGLSEQQGPWR